MTDKIKKAIAFLEDMNECTYGNLEEVNTAINSLKAWDSVKEEIAKLDDSEVEFAGYRICLDVIDKHLKGVEE